MADYPDFTYRGDVDIIAQTIANLSVDIAAQTLTALGINITAQDLAELIIKINAQAVGIYLQPEWAAKEGQDKTIVGTAQDAGWGGFATTTYEVPTGKTLYINSASFIIHAEGSADYDHFLVGALGLTTNTTTIAVLGGLGGGSITFPRPVVLSAGETLGVLLVNYANVACRLTFTVIGYEV